MNQFLTRTLKAGKELFDGTSETIAYAAEKIVQPVTDIKYIREKNNEIKTMIDEANARIEPSRINANKRLEAFGEVKLIIIGSTLNEFTLLIKSVKNLSFVTQDLESNDNNVGFSEKKLQELTVATASVKSLLKDGSIAAAGSVLSASAIYGTVALLGTASTGTVIGTLSGAAATNATLAWLGGGALAVGGGGIAIGTVVLGGIALVPTISYFIWKGEFNFSDKREKVDLNYQEALRYSQSVDEAIKRFDSIERFLDNATTVIERYNITCIRLNKQLINIINAKGLNYTKYMDEQQRIIQKHMKYIDILLNLINAPIMTENGSLNETAVATIKEANDFIVKHGEIKFIDFKKAPLIWPWLLLLLVLLGLLSGGLYIYLEDPNFSTISQSLKLTNSVS